MSSPFQSGYGALGRTWGTIHRHGFEEGVGRGLEAGGNGCANVIRFETIGDVVLA
jgi:hypothetical protein